jgi:hypothetical protein
MSACSVVRRNIRGACAQLAFKRLVVFAREVRLSFSKERTDDLQDLLEVAHRLLEREAVGPVLRLVPASAEDQDSLPPLVSSTVSAILELSRVPKSRRTDQGADLRLPGRGRQTERSFRAESPPRPTAARLAGTLLANAQPPPALRGTRRSTTAPRNPGKARGSPCTVLPPGRNLVGGTPLSPGVARAARVPSRRRDPGIWQHSPRSRVLPGRSRPRLRPRSPR